MFSLECLDTLTPKRHLNSKGNIWLPLMNHTCASHCGNDVSLLLFYFFKDCKRCESVLWVMLQQKNTFTSKTVSLRKYRTNNLHFNVLVSKEAYLKKKQKTTRTKNPGSPLTSRWWSSWPGRGCVCCRMIWTRAWACVHSPWAEGLFAPPRSQLGCRELSF